MSGFESLPPVDDPLDNNRLIGLEEGGEQGGRAPVDEPIGQTTRLTGPMVSNLKTKDRTYENLRATFRMTDVVSPKAEAEWLLQSSLYTSLQNFSAPIAAFGFYGTDIGDFNGNVTIQLSNGGVQDYVVNNTLQGPNGSLLFWGIIAGAGETFTSAAFGNTAQGSDFFGFDDLVIGDLGQVAPVPEPTALVLLGAGLALGLRRRKTAR